MSRKLSEFSNMPSRRSATLSFSGWLSPPVKRLLPNIPPWSETSRVGRKPATLLHAVDDAAGAAAAEDHGVGSLERFDAIQVVQVAVVLDVVAHAVDEEVGRRAVAADDRPGRGCSRPGAPSRRARSA